MSLELLLLFQKTTFSLTPDIPLAIETNESAPEDQKVKERATE